MQGPVFSQFGNVADAAGGALIFAIFIIVVVGYLLGLSTESKLVVNIGKVAPFGLLGVVIGYIAGSSAEPLVGALLSYAFAKDAGDDLRTILPYSVACLCMAALAGMVAGKYGRVAFDDYQRSYDQWKMRYEKVDIPAMAAKVRYFDCVKLSAPNAHVKCADLLIK